MSSRLPFEEPAILVGQSDYRETDRIVRLLTPNHGLISAIARGAKASQRRFGGSLDFGNKLQATLQPGRGDLWTLQEVRLLEGRAGARGDLVRSSQLAYACEVCGLLARPDGEEPRLFGLLEVACLLIEAAPRPPAALFRLGLEAKALTFSGLAPALSRCAACEEPLEGGPGGPGRPPGWTFSPVAGGALHEACDAEGCPAVTKRWLAGIEHARRTPLQELIAVSAPAGPLWLLAQMIEAHTEQTLRSRALLASVHPHG